MDVAAKVTSKGQVTLPRQFETRWASARVTQFSFRVDGDHAILARTPGFLGLAGSIQGACREAERGVGRRLEARTCDSRNETQVAVFVDATVLVSHLTGEPLDFATRATRFPSQRR